MKSVDGRTAISLRIGLVICWGALVAYLARLAVADAGLAGSDGVGVLDLALLTLALLALLGVTILASRPRLGSVRKREESGYRQFFESAGDAMYVTDRRKRIVDCNQAMVELVGYTRRELLHLDFADLYARQGDRRMFEYVMTRQGTVKDYDLKLRRKDGREIDCLLSASSRIDENGKLQGYQGIIRDITFSKRVEEALRDGEEKYRTLFERTPMGLGVADDEGHLLAFNEAMLEPGGYRPDDVARLNSVAELFYDPHDVKRAMAAAQRFGSLRKYDVRLRRKDGGYYDALLSLTPIRLGAQLGWQVMVEDVSERKRAEENLRREKGFSDTVIESLPGIFCLFGSNGRLLRWNHNLEGVSGYSSEELAELRLLDFFSEGDRRTVEEMFVEVLSRGRASLEADFVGKGGDPTPYYFTGTRVSLDGQRCVIGMGVDISERKRLEQQFFLSQKLEAVGKLAGGVAHDFNNLLTAILGSSELLLAELDADDPRRADVEEVTRAGRRAASLTRQLLAFGRRQMMQPRVLDLNRVVADISSMLLRLIGEDVELVTVLEPELWSVKVDPGQIEQVIVNMAVNARDAMPSGGRLVIETANIELESGYTWESEVVRAGSYVMTSVSDTGHGMDEATVARIFEPFFTTKGQGKGTGLGLSTAYGIVKQSGGHMFVNSAPGQGSTFKFYLPAVAEAAEQVGMPERATPVPRGSETVLLVEDEDAVRRVLRKELERHGYTVLEASGGEEALQIAASRSDTIQLLVTDVVMPLMSGPDLARRLIDSHPKLKILYVSGYADDAIVRQGALEPGTPILQKPFAAGALAEKVRELLDAASPSRTRPGSGRI